MTGIKKWGKVTVGILWKILVMAKMVEIGHLGHKINFFEGFSKSVH